MSLLYFEKVIRLKCIAQVLGFENTFKMEVLTLSLNRKLKSLKNFDLLFNT